MDYLKLFRILGKKRINDHTKEQQNQERLQEKELESTRNLFY